MPTAQRKLEKKWKASVIRAAIDMDKARSPVRLGDNVRKVQFHINLAVDDVDCEKVCTSLFINGVFRGRLELSHGEYNVLEMILHQGCQGTVIPVVYAPNDEKYHQYLEAHRR